MKPVLPANWAVRISRCKVTCFLIWPWCGTAKKDCGKNWRSMKTKKRGAEPDCDWLRPSC